MTTRAAARTARPAGGDAHEEGPWARLRRSNPIGYLFTLPYLVFFAVFVAYPAGFAVFLAFHNWNIVRPEKPFVGFANFERLFRDELFWRALYNTGVFLVVHIPLQIVVALLLAVVLNQQLVARGLFRVSFFLPYVTSGAIISLVWLRLYADDGLLNQLLAKADLGPALDKAVFPGLQGGPLDHVIAAKAVAFREAAQPEFSDYARDVVANAAELAEALAGHGFRLVSGGTDNHLMLIDLRSFDEELTGKAAQHALDLAGITLNKNTVPDDPRSPFVTSGLRIGTPAVTTQGMREAEMEVIAELITRVLRAPEDDSVIRAVRDEVAELCSGFTPYPD